MTILPLRRLFIERQIQPEMLSFVPTEEVVALFNMCVSLLVGVICSYFVVTAISSISTCVALKLEPPRPLTYH
jgi:hypothetical protein